jgi:hypothetical protein
MKTERDLSSRFKVCASDREHGLKLHRIHLQSPTKSGSFQSSVVFDCRCGQRWLLRVLQGDVVAVDGAVLADLRRGREGQATAPPGYAAARE